MSSSRYDDVEIEDEIDGVPYYTNPDDQIISDGDHEDGQQYDDHINDEMYQNAKNSLQRTKILLMSSQKDMQMYNEMGYSGHDEQDPSEINSSRVQNILRNKQKRKVHQNDYSDYTKKFLNDASINESTHSNMKHLSEIERESSQSSNLNFEQNELTKDQSRNYLNNQKMTSDEMYDPNRYIHQTTSSGNLVLYDSVSGGISNVSPRDTFEPQYNRQHHQMDYSEHEGQNERVAGKFCKVRIQFNELL